MQRLFWLCALPMAAVALANGSNSQSISVNKALQIPGRVLQPGKYTFSLEDRMPGRAIVRIADAATGAHELLLAVPSAHLGNSAVGNSVIVFERQDTRQVLRGWLCPGCSKPLEIVYPKDEAVQITADSGQPVLAADPAYDKLPANLSADDMKVVTLWLLKPEHVTDHKGVGLQAAKYTVMEDAAVRTRLPQTASNTFFIGLIGLVLLAGFGALRLSRLRGQ